MFLFNFWAEEEKPAGDVSFVFLNCEKRNIFEKAKKKNWEKLRKSIAKHFWQTDTKKRKQTLCKQKNWNCVEEDFSSQRHFFKKGKKIA